MKRFPRILLTFPPLYMGVNVRNFPFQRILNSFAKLQTTVES